MAEKTQESQPKGDSGRDNATNADRDVEAHTLSNKPKITSHFLFGPVEKERADLALLACCLVTGMVDGASFSEWGVFVGMQTGNTVILGLSTAGLPSNPHAWLTTLIAILSFLIGCFLTFRVSHYLLPSGPATNRLLTSALFLLQSAFLIIAAALATVPGIIPQDPVPSSRSTPEDPDVIRNIKIVALIPLLGFQNGIQIAASRLLGFNELPVNVLTSTYCDIMGDMKLLALNNVKRNRRCAAVALLLIGAIVSGWLLRSRGGLCSVLWIAAGIKALAGLGVLGFLPEAKAKQGEKDGKV